MLQDARTLASGSSISADVCIVGAGPAGISLALELEQVSDATILLVESGGFEEEPDTTALTTGDVVGMPIRGGLGSPTNLTEVRRRQIGGTSNLWGGFCRPLTVDELGPQPQQLSLIHI